MNKFILVIFLVCFSSLAETNFVSIDGKIIRQTYTKDCTEESCKTKMVYEVEELLFSLNSRFKLEVTNAKKLLSIVKEPKRRNKIKGDILFFSKSEKELKDWVEKGMKNQFEDPKLQTWLGAASYGVPFLRKRRESIRNVKSKN